MVAQAAKIQDGKVNSKVPEMFLGNAVEWLVYT